MASSPLNPLLMKHDDLLIGIDDSMRTITVADVKKTYRLAGGADRMFDINPFATGKCLCCEENVGDEDAIAVQKQLENREKNCMWCGEDFDLTEEQIVTALSDNTEGDY